jgi:RHS repeat-associated protein
VIEGRAGYVDEAFAFTGRFFDRATGLQNNLERWYDPNTSRWLSEDPIGFAAGDANLYRYVGNRPTSESDPLGLAHFGKRPLQGLPWLGPFSSNLLDDWACTDLSHAEVFFDDGKEPTNLGFFDDSTVRPDRRPFGYRMNEAQYDDELMRKAVENVGTPGKYSLMHNNCQHYTKRLREEYERLKNQNAPPRLP